MASRVAVAQDERRALPPGVTLNAPLTEEWSRILTGEAAAFLAGLHREFEPRRQELLARRVARMQRLESGELPGFLPGTEGIRLADWTVAPIPADLADRRVDITGPVDRKMVINALNSGASVYMADFEDANAPTWSNNLDGQVNLYDAVRESIDYESPEGKRYALNDAVATLMVRPRGWHLEEKHFLVDGEPISASLFDFGLFFFHNAAERVARGTAPYFYLPKLESHLEARLWNDVFVYAQGRLGLPEGTVRATVLIENILAAFEMDEILWELKDHSAGLNCGRWDYIFSFIKKFRTRPEFVLPDRGQVTMDRAFLDAYVRLLIRTCHRRGIHAMGGMAAQIPVKGDAAANESALSKVRQDKLREVEAGHDGTWVAHPALVAVAKAVFDEHMPGPNQIARRRDDVHVTAEELIAVPGGTITVAGLRQNVDVGIQYLEAWLRGVGCVPIYNLMEDAATAEISRSQVWQWVEHGARLADGRVVNARLVREVVCQVLDGLRRALGPERFEASEFALASTLFDQMMTSPDYPEWLTAVAYEYID
ncbi:MAG: malate synthase A [Gemmatimonadota bacterium]